MIFSTAYKLATDARDEAEAALHAWYREASGREIMDVAAAARTSFKNGVWPGYVPLNEPLAPSRLVEASHKHRDAVAAILSMHRSGYVRELALAHLEHAKAPRVVPFLLLRADDIVPALRERAEKAIEVRLRPDLADTFARCLGIVEMLRGRSRGGGGPLVRHVQDFLAQPECREGLALACSDEDAVVRRAAFALRLRGEPAVHVLASALADRDTHIRHWAARTAISRVTTDEDKRALVPLLAASRSAWTRSLALRAREHFDRSDDFLEEALLDHHEAVRYLAMTLLRKRHPDRAFGETRKRALAILASKSAPVRELVGALGALADVGLAGDASEVARLLEDPRPSVRAEAARTSSMLRVSAPPRAKA